MWCSHFVKAIDCCGIVRKDFKWSICVNYDANFRISYRFKCLTISFFHHDISYKVSSGNFIATFKLPLLYLRNLSWDSNMALQYSGSDWFTRNKDVRVPIKLASSLIVNFGFIGMMQHFSQIFCFFWSDKVSGETKIIHYFGWYQFAFIWMYYKANLLKQVYCFYHSKETLFKALIYSNYVISLYCNCISLLS